MPNVQLAVDVINITPFGGEPFNVPGPVWYSEEYEVFYAGGASYPAEIVSIEKAPDGAGGPQSSARERDILNKIIAERREMSMDITHEDFHINDDAQAEWAINKIREARAEAQKMEQHYQEQLQRIRQRTDETVEYMTGLLEEYFNSVPRHSTKTGIEKYKLPSGELIRKPAGSTLQHDDAQLLAWCREKHPEYIKITEKPSWADIKWHIKETGEYPAGVTAVEEPAQFSVKVG